MVIDVVTVSLLLLSCLTSPFYQFVEFHCTQQLLKNAIVLGAFFPQCFKMVWVMGLFGTWGAREGACLVLGAFFPQCTGPKEFLMNIIVILLYYFGNELFFILLLA